MSVTASVSMNNRKETIHAKIKNHDVKKKEEGVLPTGLMKQLNDDRLEIYFIELLFA